APQEAVDAARAAEYATLFRPTLFTPIRPAAPSPPSTSDRPPARTAAPRGSPTPPATARAACRRRRTPAAPRSYTHSYPPAHCRVHPAPPGPAPAAPAGAARGTPSPAAPARP